MKSRFSRRELFAICAGAGLTGVFTAPAAAPAKRRSSRVVTARVKRGDTVDTAALGRLLDRSIVALTGASTSAEAWTSLFSPSDHVAVKVNCLAGPGMSTSHTLVRSVVDRLLGCGVKPRRIVVWDRSGRELREAGFDLSKGGNDIQCYGTDDAGYAPTLFENDSVASLFSRIVTERCNKIVNMPILKDHGICGMTFALKNHFGAINNPNKYHLNRCDPYIADLNASAPIRSREVLIVGDLTKIQADGGPSYKKQWVVSYGGIMTATDPVAADAAALGILERAREELGRPSLKSKGLEPGYITTSHRKGIGNMDAGERIELTNDSASGTER